MKYFLTAILLLSPFNDLDKIARVNKTKKEAREAYLNGNYEAALNKYRYLTDSLQVIDDDIRLNIANAYYNLADTAQAIDNYSQLFDSKSKTVRSTAHQQMGILSSKNKKFEEALDHFREAIKANPANEDARYNYELMKKILKKQEEQEQQQQNQDQKNQEDKKDQEQQNQDQQNKDQQQKQEEQQQEQNKEGEGEEQEKDQEQQQEEQKKEEEGEQKEEQQPKPQEGEEAEEKEGEEQQNPLSEKLEEMKISEEKAKMILEALKNKEIQYYQQNKRKPTKRKDPKKPDW
ncbi:MAG: tetratricopeptide repeat protein [Bacteroidota bacterium]